MKNYVIILICLLVSGIALGQNQSKELLEVKVTPPKFTGIENVVKLADEAQSNSIAQYVANNFVFQEINGLFLEGTEVVRFIVSPNGEITEFNVINSVSPKIDKEVIRVLQTTNGMWEPGYNNEKPVAMEKEIALEIKVGETERGAIFRDFTKKAEVCFTKGNNKFLLSKNPKKALKYYDKGILYRPYDQSLYYLRGLCRYELGMLEGARQDWIRLKSLGGINMDDHFLAKDISKLKGYEEFTAMFAGNKE